MADEAGGVAAAAEREVLDSEVAPNAFVSSVSACPVCAFESCNRIAMLQHLKEKHKTTISELKLKHGGYDLSSLPEAHQSSLSEALEHIGLECDRIRDTQRPIDIEERHLDRVHRKQLDMFGRPLKKKGNGQFDVELETLPSDPETRSSKRRKLQRQMQQLANSQNECGLN